ncbi:hypothetical protein ANCCAN_08823 [Ancylostoma caninum]|uniref:Uncharacterized protein n=1 Tax=Ancylostoma caninum TaxID=29170 RepID=A0A368GL88_ANCCA|nr:hypothetical protein ANCCAN_08823 [Ancylostoma caninum]
MLFFAPFFAFQVVPRDAVCPFTLLFGSKTLYTSSSCFQSSSCFVFRSWSVQPALMQQLVTQLNQMQFAQQQQQQGQQTVAADAVAAAAPVAMKKTSSIAAQTQLHTSPTKASSVDATMRPPRVLLNCSGTAAFDVRMRDRKWCSIKIHEYISTAFSHRHDKVGAESTSDFSG